MQSRIIVAGGYYEKHKTAAVDRCAFCRIDRLRRDAGRGLEARRPVWLLGVGKAYEIEKGHFYWVGEYSGTFFNDKGEKSLFDHAGVKCPAWDDLDLNKKRTKRRGYASSLILMVTRLISHGKTQGTSGSAAPERSMDGWNGQIQGDQRK